MEPALGGESLNAAFACARVKSRSVVLEKPLAGFHPWFPLGILPPGACAQFVKQLHRFMSGAARTFPPLNPLGYPPGEHPNACPCPSRPFTRRPKTPQTVSTPAYPSAHPQIPPNPLIPIEITNLNNLQNHCTLILRPAHNRHRRPRKEPSAVSVPAIAHSASGMCPHHTPRTFLHKLRPSQFQQRVYGSPPSICPLCVCKYMINIQLQTKTNMRKSTVKL